MAKIAVAAAALVVLGGCSRTNEHDQQAEARLRLAETNLRRAAAASTAMVDRIERLEERVDELEQNAD